MNTQKLPELDTLYKKFRDNEFYRERKQQFAFVPVAKQIIEETLKNDPITNLHLTGLIQSLKWACTANTFDKYLSINISDPIRRKRISDEAYATEQYGYTAAGKTAITRLNQTQLEQVKSFLLEALQTNDSTTGKKLCDNYDALNVPEVKSGVYSPWLFYINPYVFPIINRTHTTFLNWMGIPTKYSACIEAFAVLKLQTHEDELGTLDAFAYKFDQILADYGKTGDIRLLDLNGRPIFKISHGSFVKHKDFKDAPTAEKLMKLNWICMHTDTAKGQANVFWNVEIGDYVYLCYGGGRLGWIAKITSDAALVEDEDISIVNDNEGWMYRVVEPLFEPVVANAFDLSDTKWGWMPSGYTTFYQVPPSDIGKANELLFIPKYNIRLLNSSKRDLNEPEFEIEFETSKPMPSLNTILYGPPGTGKTYNTIIKAAKIISGKELNYSEAKTVYQPLLGDQIEFITFHQNYSYEDFVVGLKPKLEGTGLNFQKHEGIFFKMCKRAEKNYKGWKEGLQPIEPTFEKVLYEFLKPLQEGNEVEVRLDIGGKSFFINDSSPYMLNYRMGDGKQESLNLETIQALYTNNTSPQDSKHIYHTPLVKELKAIAHRLKKETTRVELKKYVLIIDEINRANISRVFGELITLLEDDKRLGNPHEMTITLASGEEKFSVPNNLYIIGTMNTADKSIALLDIALRRRFVFEDMYPRESIIDNLIPPPYNTFLKRLNAAILDKKGPDFLIGHAYFIPDKKVDFNFETVMNRKIIPLLNEYFYNQKSGSISSLLESAIQAVADYKIDKDDYLGVVCHKTS